MLRIWRRFQILCLKPENLNCRDVGEDLTLAIATAPVLRNQVLMKSIGELENEINESSYTINQVQVTAIPGLDLSKLIANSLCPIDQIEEHDEPWDWVWPFINSRMYNLAYALKKWGQ
jgi:hypothetical protein